MATVTSAIKMMDVMSGPLKKITSSMNIMIKTMHDMQNATDKNIKVDKQLITAQKQIASAEAEIVKQIDRATKEQESFNRSVKEGESNASGLVKKIGAVAAAYLGVNKIKSFLSASTDAANETIRAEQRLLSIMSNINGMTQDGIDLVKRRAKELEAEGATIAASTGIYGQSQLAEYVYDPKNIADMSESMYNLATETYGAKVSQDQLMQTANLMGKVMMGDINALSRNGFRMDAIFTEAEQKLLKTGTEAERAALVIQMIDENLSGLSQAMGETPEGQAIRYANAWGAVQEKIGYGVMPLMTQFMSYIMTNMPVIESILLSAFGNIFSVIEGVMNISMATADFFVNNWSWIAPVLWGIVAAMTAYLLITNAVAIATRVAAAAQAVYNAILNLNPFVLIISLIIALIVIFVRLWQTNDKFVAAMMRAWNAVLNFFDQIPIFFVRVGNGITNAFQDMKVTSLKIVETLANGVIDTINWLIGKLNKIPGVSIDTLTHLEFSAGAAAEAEAIREAGEAKVLEMQEGAAKKAADREQKVLDMLDDRAAKREEKEKKKEDRFSAPDLYGAGSLGGGMWDVGDGSLLDVGKVKEVGKIKDKVDISSEDLKMMRELAEMKNVQNYVTLQPSISFGDTHVRRESDLNTIVARITETLNEDIASSVDAVYE